MTVSELIALLSTLPADATVSFPDTYEREEGWLPAHDAATYNVCGAHVNERGEVELDGEE